MVRRGSLLPLENLVEQSGGAVADKINILAKGEAADRSDIIFFVKFVREKDRDQEVVIFLFIINILFSY